MKRGGGFISRRNCGTTDGFFFLEDPIKIIAVVRWVRAPRWSVDTFEGGGVKKVYGL